jgi:hypothetical protein
MFLLLNRTSLLSFTQNLQHELLQYLEIQLLGVYCVDYFATGDFTDFTDFYGSLRSGPVRRIVAMIWNFYYLKLLCSVFNIYITADSMVVLIN